MAFFSPLPVRGAQRLRALGIIAIDGDGLQPQAPAFHVGVHHVFHGALFRHVDGLRNRARNERLGRGHHPHVAHIVDGALAVLRPEAAIEHRQMLVLERRRAFDGAGGVDMGDDHLHLLGRIAQLDQRLRHGVVDDLDDPAAHQLLVFHQRQVGLDAGGVAIHHEADGAGRRDHRSLRVAEADALAQGIGIVPAITAAANRSSGTRLLSMPLTALPCIRITSRNESSLTA